MKLTNKSFEVEFKFSTYALMKLSEYTGKDPYSLFSSAGTATFNEYIQIVRAGLAGARLEEVSIAEACEVIDNLGGTMAIDWAIVFKEYADAVITPEVAKKMEALGDKKKLKRSTGTKKPTSQSAS